MSILKARKILKNKIIGITCHNSINLIKIIDAFEEIIKIYKIKIIFPVHPRTQKILKKIKRKYDKNIIFIKPLSYLNFLSLNEI